MSFPPIAKTSSPQMPGPRRRDTLVRLQQQIEDETLYSYTDEAYMHRTSYARVRSLYPELFQTRSSPSPTRLSYVPEVEKNDRFLPAMSPTQLDQSFTYLQKQNIRKENYLLRERLKQIKRRKPKRANSEWDPYRMGVQSHSTVSRRLEQGNIELENERLLHRLLSVRSTIPA
eukprot:Rmarinus@m.10660